MFTVCSVTISLIEHQSTGPTHIHSLGANRTQSTHSHCLRAEWTCKLCVCVHTLPFPLPVMRAQRQSHCTHWSVYRAIQWRSLYHPQPVVHWVLPATQRGTHTCLYRAAALSRRRRSSNHFSAMRTTLYRAHTPQPRPPCHTRDSKFSTRIRYTFQVLTDWGIF